MTCPNAASYSIDGDGLVEVNGVQPHFDKDSSQAARLLRVWAKWGSAIYGSAQRYAVPPEWILGVMMQESGGDPAACSPCGEKCCGTHLGRKCCAFGIMQFVPTTADQYGTSVEQMLQDPVLAIDIGTKFLRDLLKRYDGDFIMATAAYNAGTPRCGGSTTFGYVSDNDYSFQVVQWSNTAIKFGLPKPSIAAPFIATMGLVAAGLIMADVIKLKGI